MDEVLNDTKVEFVRIKESHLCEKNRRSVSSLLVLQHEIYVVDINEQGETRYWKLHNALYGLKQADHEWYNMLTSIMHKAGYHRSTLKKKSETMSSSRNEEGQKNCSEWSATGERMVVSSC